MSALDAKIDDLYKLPLGEFTGARNALAKTLTREEAKLVKALAKPTVVPWAVNQIYWRARSTFDRLLKSGEKLRAAQIAALEGRAADVRSASDAHRRAIGEAVAEAERLSASSGAKPGADALARTFEALSLATTASQPPGRLTEALQPAGFEALLGVTPWEVGSTKSEVRSRRLEVVKAVGERRTANGEPRTTAATRAAERAAAEAAAKEAAERKRHEADVKNAEDELARVQASEQKARETWERAHDALLEARRLLAEAKSRARHLKSEI